MAGDLYWANVGLALHLNDVGLTDIKGNAMTLTGVVRSSTQSKFGGSSAYFDGASELLNTIDLVPDISTGPFTAQFWVRPGTQTQTYPTVFSAQDVTIQYKPTDFVNGFVLDVGGVRTAFGYHTENSWYYISVVKSAPTVEVWIDGALAYTQDSVTDGTYGTVVRIGAADIGGVPATGFVGYVDDVLVTTSIARTTHSVPTAAFDAFQADFIGVGAGAVLVQGVGVGEVPPSGSASADIQIRGVGVGTVPPVGVGSGQVPVTGSGAGVLGRALVGSGAVRIAGVGVGAHGRFGVGSGVVRVLASGAVKRGNACSGSALVRVIGNGVGSTALYPVAVGRGTIRVAGFAVGASGEEEFCA